MVADLSLKHGLGRLGNPDQVQNVPCPSQLRLLDGMEKKSRISKLLFYLGYGLWITWKFGSITVLSFPEGSLAHTLLHAAVLVLMLTSIILNRPKYSVVVLSGIILITSLLVMMQSGQSILLDLVLMLIASTGYSYRSIAKLTLVLIGALIMMTVCASQIGLIVDYPFSRGETIRHGLGFRYSTYLSHLYLNLVLLYIYLRFNHLSWWEYALIGIVDVYIFVMTDSRNSFALVFLVLFASLMIRVCGQSKLLFRVISCGARFGFICVFAIGSIAAISYDSASPTWNSINAFTSNRLAQEHTSLLRYGITPFGQEIEFAGNSLIMGESLEINKEANKNYDRNVIENSLIKTGVQYGGVSLILVLAAQYIAARYASRNKDLVLLLTLLIVALHSYFDPQLMDLLYTTVWFYVWGAVALGFSSSRLGKSIDSRIDSIIRGADYGEM